MWGLTLLLPLGQNDQLPANVKILTLNGKVLTLNGRILALET